MQIDSLNSRALGWTEQALAVYLDQQDAADAAEAHFEEAVERSAYDAARAAIAAGQIDVLLLSPHVGEGTDWNALCPVLHAIKDAARDAGWEACRRAFNDEIEAARAADMERFVFSDLPF